LSSKTKSIRVNKLFGSAFEVNVINFIARYGNYTRKSLYVRIHGALSKYIEMTDPTFINGCTGKYQIIPVTMFLVMLYNACFIFQKDKDTNMLITALDTLVLGADVDHEKFMNTLSESKFFEKFHSGILCFKHLWQYNIFSIIAVSAYPSYKMHYRGILLMPRLSYQTPPLQKQSSG
jgi:hypothetical protein